MVVTLSATFHNVALETAFKQCNIIVLISTDTDENIITENMKIIKSPNFVQTCNVAPRAKTINGFFNEVVNKQLAH